MSAGSPILRSPALPVATARLGARHRRPLLALLQLALLLAFVAPAIRSAVRDNDQATFIQAAHAIARGQLYPFADPPYNFDKQYGTYLLVAGLMRVLPTVDPVTLGNLLLAVLYAAGSLAVYFHLERDGLPRWVGSVLVLAPSMVLYAPFLGSSELSLAFLLLAYPLLRRRRGGAFYVGLGLLAVATAVRVDAFFCVPALYVASAARRPFLETLRDRRLWLLTAAVAVPLLAGRLLVAQHSRDDAPPFFVPAYYAALMLFAIGLPWLATAAAFTISSVRAAVRRPRQPGRLLFGLATVAAMWASLAFYAPQMYSARYFFPAFFSSLVLLASRRGRWWARAFARALPVGPILLTVLAALPWFLGLRMLSARSAVPSMLQASTMPTADGLWPMGGYGGFQARLIADDDRLDHNQATLDAARSVRYRPCADGRVEVRFTPLANFIEEAAEEQGFRSRRVLPGAQQRCPIAYLELRALLRGDLPRTPAILAHALRWESTPGAARPILSVDRNAPANATTAEVLALITAAHGRDGELHTVGGGESRPIELNPGFAALIFTDDPRCLPSEASLLSVPGSLLYWADLHAGPRPRAYTLCAQHNGGWLQSEAPEFMQRVRSGQ